MVGSFLNAFKWFFNGFFNGRFFGSLIVASLTSTTSSMPTALPLAWACNTIVFGRLSNLEVQLKLVHQNYVGWLGCKSMWKPASNQSSLWCLRRVMVSRAHLPSTCTYVNFESLDHHHPLSERGCVQLLRRLGCIRNVLLNLLESRVWRPQRCMQRRPA